MTGVMGALRRTSTALRPAARGWRIGAVAVVVLVLALASVVRYHPAGLLAGSSTKGPGLARTGGAPGSGGHDGSGVSGGTSGNGAGNRPNGVGGAAPAQSPGAGGGGAGGGSGSSHASPTPSIAMPTPNDSVYGTPDVKLSNCAGGYEPGTQCAIYYHGVYELASHPAGKLLVEVIIDGTTVVQDTFVAPGGPHRFGDTVRFTVPQHAKKIIYQSQLQDATGKALVTSPAYTTYGYG